MNSYEYEDKLLGLTTGFSFNKSESNPSVPTLCHEDLFLMEDRPLTSTANTSPEFHFEGDSSDRNQAGVSPFLDEETSMGSSHLETDSGSRVIERTKRISKKTFEPIYDGKKQYVYSENPGEYMKARKRVQNRESARRVRSSMKDFVGNVHQDLEELKRENTSLKLLNASLQAENNLLKQQLSFMEKLVMKQSGSAPQPPNQPSPGSLNQWYELPVYNEPSDNGMEVIRVKPEHAILIRKQLTYLTIFTIFLGVSAMVSGFQATPSGSTGPFKGVDPGTFTSMFAQSLDTTVNSFGDGFSGNMDPGELVAKLKSEMTRSYMAMWTNSVSIAQTNQRLSLFSVFNGGLFLLYLLYLVYFFWKYTKSLRQIIKIKSN